MSQSKMFTRIKMPQWQFMNNLQQYLSLKTTISKGNHLSVYSVYSKYTFLFTEQKMLKDFISQNACLLHVKQD